MIRPVPGLTIEEQPDVVLLRMALWAEARGESALGQLAVAWVIKNRSAHRLKTIGQIVLQPRQFSSFNDNDPNRGKLLTADKDDLEGWTRADAVAGLQAFGATIDPTQGALDYYNPAICQPAWGRGNPGWQEHIVIGNHTFGIAQG